MLFDYHADVTELQGYYIDEWRRASSMGFWWTPVGSDRQIWGRCWREEVAMIPQPRYVDKKGKPVEKDGVLVRAGEWLVDRFLRWLAQQ